MYETMRRLQPRGAANRGVCVDADGAMLGPDWPLVEQTSTGYCVAPRKATRDVQKVLLLGVSAPDWLYKQGRRIADALNRGELALAQIYGLRIPAGDIDHRQLKRLAALAALRKAGFNPDEPRIPAGEPDGGEWTDGDDAGSADAGPMPVLAYSEEPTAPHLIGGRWPAPVGANPLFQPTQAEGEDDENGRRGGLLGEFMDPFRELREERYEWLRIELRNLEPNNLALQTLTGPDYSPTWADIDELSEALREAQERANEPASTDWELGPALRGMEAELWRLGGVRKYPFNTPTIDNFTEDGVAISIKSIDLNSAWYRDPTNLSRRIDSYVNKLANFDGLNWGRMTIRQDQINGKILDVIVPKNAGTAVQWQSIAASIERADKMGVTLWITPY